MKTTPSINEHPAIPGLLRAEEVAKILNVSTSQAYKLMEQGEIPVIRMLRSIRVHPDDLHKYIQHCRVERQN